MTAEEIDLFIVRHGLTEANKRGITNGRMDEPLAVEGLDQADRLADRLQYKHIDIIYSSPLQRSVQTASPIARKLGKTINLDDRLIEVGFGEFEGKPN